MDASVPFAALRGRLNQYKLTGRSKEITMAESRVFSLRPFPRRLLRSLLTFAFAGTLMAFVVWSDGMGGPWLPAGILAACWAIPLLFAWQIRRGGFDPLLRIVTTEQGLEAHYRDGASLFLPWEAITRLVAVHAFRNQAWAIVAPQGAVRWFGEMEGREDFEQLVAARTGLAWEAHDKYPEDVFKPAGQPAP
jgi:hypothetical protein